MLGLSRKIAVSARSFSDILGRNMPQTERTTFLGKHYAIINQAVGMSNIWT